MRSADWWVLATAVVAGTNGLTCTRVPKDGAARDSRCLDTHPMTDYCKNDDNNGNHWPCDNRTAISSVQWVVVTSERCTGGRRGTCRRGRCGAWCGGPCSGLYCCASRSFKLSGGAVAAPGTVDLLQWVMLPAWSLLQPLLLRQPVI
ncbi:hypothetical protein evm_015531, partial [Chilo suppressalis]